MSMMRSELLVKLAVRDSDRAWEDTRLVECQTRALSEKHFVLFIKIKIK